MSLLKSVGTIAGSSVITQIIGAASIWLLSDRYGMAEVGIYALTFSIVLIGAQVCTFASQLLLPKQTNELYNQNIVFCLLQSAIVAVPYAIVCYFIFDYSFYFLYLLTLCHAWVLISENMLLRHEKIKALAFQRLSISILVVSSIMLTANTTQFYWVWAICMFVLVNLWISISVKWSTLTASHFSWAKNYQFFKDNLGHISGIGSAEVLAMANANLPTILVTFWFSSLTAGYFAVVNRFCLSPIIVVGNAVRNSIFSKWSIDFRNNRFNYQEFKKVRLMLFVLGAVATAGIFVFYPIVMKLGFDEEWISSIPTSQYMLPYIFPALAVCPLTVIELVFGSPKYFFRIQVEQLLVVLSAFVIFPYFFHDYEYSVLLYGVLSFVRYCFIYIKVNRRAYSLKNPEEVPLFGGSANKQERTQGPDIG
ncbi:MAG: hypothetical protein WBM99_14555 [Psychromonas sp.]